MIAEATSDAPFSVAALLALVVLLAGAIAWWQRTRGTLAGGDAIKLVAVRALGGKRLLALVEVESERYLLGLTDESIACLAHLDADRADRAAAADPSAAELRLERSA